MDIERIRPDPKNSSTGAMWTALFLDCSCPKTQLEEFKEIVYQEIHDDIEDYNFDGFMWRRKPEYITEDNFETMQRVNKFSARVNYFKKDKTIRY